MDIGTTIRVALVFASSAAIVAYGDAADPCNVLLREMGAVNAGDEDLQNKLDVERSCVERFMALPYARLPVSLMETPVDFNTRIRCIEEIAKFDLLREDTNVLASISTHIEGLKPLPTDRQLDDAKAARTILLHLCYTQEQVDEFNNFKPDGKTMRGALLTHPAYGDLFAAIDREYAFRRLYNARLERYKREALKTIRDSVQGERRKRRVVPSRTPGSVNFPTAGICPTAAEAPRDRDIAVAVEFEQTQGASDRPVAAGEHEVDLVGPTAEARPSSIAGWCAYPSREEAQCLFSSERINHGSIALHEEDYQDFAARLEEPSMPENTRVIEAIILKGLTSLAVHVSTNAVDDGVHPLKLASRGRLLQSIVPRLRDYPTNAVSCLVVAGYAGTVKRVEFPDALTRTRGGVLRMCITTNEVELARFQEEECVRKMEVARRRNLQWRVRRANEAVADYRHTLMKACAIGVEGCRGIMSDEEFATFTNQVVTASRANADEQRILFGGLQKP